MNDLIDIDSINPLTGESIIPYDINKEILYTRYKHCVELLIKNSFIEKELEPYILSSIRRKLGLPIIGIFDVSVSLDNITL